MSERLVKALAVTCELMGQALSDAALEQLVQDLAGYQEADVLAGLDRCRRELKRMTLSDVLDRLPGGHPGPEEAWAIVDAGLDEEARTLVWTEEMAEASGAARPLRHDRVAARMAFREVYVRVVAQARQGGRRPAWRVSLGWDAAGREEPIRDAVKLGRLTQAAAQPFLPVPTETRRALPLPTRADPDEGFTRFGS